MASRPMNDQELKFTAAMYADRPGVVDHIKKTGRMPDKIEMGGARIQMDQLLKKRGRDITLSPDEQLVYDAIRKEKRLPGGHATLADKVNKADKAVKAVKKP